MYGWVEEGRARGSMLNVPVSDSDSDTNRDSRPRGCFVIRCLPFAPPQSRRAFQFLILARGVRGAGAHVG